ncbi:BatD family protein [Vibrio fluvialis]|uniref:BatD family protein n=1 Tax=Vibrio fluvialis TaxID=676 RepID=UPI001FC93DD8|nr:BatD family protein [Vibrio fluvialis]
MKRLVLCALCLLLSSLPLSIAQADETVAPVDVKIKAWLGDDPNKIVEAWVPTQQILLHIEVSTNSWFTSGTQIKGIEIPNVLVKQRNTSAVNYTERENGQTWSIQRWEITLYPQQSGEFVVPAAQVFTQVSDFNNQKKAVTLQTAPISFRVVLPSAELAAKNGFAASAVKVQQQWSDQEDQSLKAGDSITRTVTLEANDSLSVLLPTLMPEQRSPLWSVYPAVPELDDQQSRSGYVSHRTESQTYVLLAGGEIEWPAYEFWWWNTEKGRLEKVTLEGRTIHIKHTLASWVRYYAWELAIALFVVVVLVGLAIWLKRYYQRHPTPMWFEFRQALRRGEHSRSRTMVYRKLRTETHSVALVKHSPNMSWQNHAVQAQGENATRPDFIYLWGRIKKQRQRFSLPKALPELHQSESSDS